MCDVCIVTVILTSRKILTSTLSSQRQPSLTLPSPTHFLLISGTYETTVFWEFYAYFTWWMDGWMDGWSSHPQTGGSSVLGLLGLGRCSTSSCRLTGMAITRHTGNGTHLVSGSLLWVILFFVLASILLVTLLWICLSGLLWRQLQGR